MTLDQQDWRYQLKRSDLLLCQIHISTIRHGGRAITLDGLVFLSVNNGIPMRTSYAVDSSAMTWLKQIKCHEAEVAYYSNNVNAPRDLHLSDLSLAHLETRESIVH